MCNRKVILVAILVLGLALALGAQEKFSSEKAYRIIEELSKPEYGGRKTGLPAARKAAEWIASKFKEWGLDPGGDNGSYIQEWPMIVTRQKKMAKLELKNGSFGPVEYQENNDFTLSFNSGSWKGTAEVVFLGFGLHAPEKGWDDYAGIDVKGKLLLITRGRPDDGKDYSRESERKYMMEAAVQKGAVGFLIFSQREFPIRGSTIHEDAYQPNLPVVNLSRKVARDIFQGTFKNMNNTVRDLAKSPQSFATGKIMILETFYERIEPGVGENVLAILRGSDPQLKNEYIVLGAHMDHNGMSPDGMVFTGSDDNASGTAVVMELARDFKQERARLKRSVVFAAFGGEEQGLLGSEYFADNPTVPFESICLNFNFDMVGAGNGTGGYSGMNYFPEVFRELLASYSESLSKKVQTRRGSGMGGSDHAHFIKQGIPSFGFRSSGDHPFYHRFEDDMNCINREALQFVGDRASEMLEKMGNTPTSLLFEGVLQGRTFVLFGDQVEFDMMENTKDKLTADLEASVKEKFARGVHGIVVPLVAAMPPKGGALGLYRAADELSRWIGANKDYFVPYQNGGSFNDAAGSGKLAVAVGMNGTTCVSGDIGLFRNLTKIGLDVLSINDAIDPIFEGDRLGAFGKEILQICERENVLLDWTVLDADIMTQVLGDYEGKVFIRMSVDQTKNLDDRIQDLVEKKHILLVARCHPKCEAHELSDLMDRVGDKNVHFSWRLHDRVFHGEKSSYEVFYRLIQELYETRLKGEDKDKRDVYNEMASIMGRNLKELLR